MPRNLPRQVSSAESHEEGVFQSNKALFGDGVLINGEDGQAARRAHMRAQTTARQVAERRASESRGLSRFAGREERLTAVRDREAEKTTAFAGIEAAHQVWLHAQTARLTEARGGVLPEGAPTAPPGLPAEPLAPTGRGRGRPRRLPADLDLG